MKHRRHLLLLFAGFLGWGAAGFAESPGSAQEPPAEPDKPATVTLIVDFGDGFEKRYTRLRHLPNMTVLDVMNQAKAHPRPLAFRFRGQNDTAFLTEIDGVQNQGAAKNWIYRVNKELGDRSFAVFPISAGDIVVWRFGGYDP